MGGDQIWCSGQLLKQMVLRDAMSPLLHESTIPKAQRWEGGKLDKAAVEKGSDL